MKTLDPIESARALTQCVLNEIDRVYPGKRTVLQSQYHLRSGIFYRS